MNKIEYFYLQSRKYIDDNNVTDQTIRLLLTHVNNFKNTGELLVNLHKTMQNPRQYIAYFKKIQKGIPLAYVINKTEFAGNDYYIDKRVLIPRPETEEMFYQIKPLIETKYRNGTIVDIGTGSGCLAISIKKNFVNAEVIATDISQKAINVAKINDAKHGTNVIFMRGDMLRPLIKKGIKADMIVTNPPYIFDISTVDAEVINNEPHLSLFTDNKQSHITKLFTDISKVLKPNGSVWIEINPNQAQNIMDISKEKTSTMKISIFKDMSGKKRFVSLLNE